MLISAQRQRVLHPARPGKVSVLVAAQRPASLCLVPRGLRTGDGRRQVRRRELLAQQVRGL